METGNNKQVKKRKARPLERTERKKALASQHKKKQRKSWELPSMSRDGEF